MFIAESFIRLGQRGFLGRRKETDRQSRAEIAPGWGYLVRREWRAAACRLIHSQYLAWPDPPYRGGYPRVYIYISSGRNPLPRLRIPGISSVMHLSCQSYMCCNPQGYARMHVCLLLHLPLYVPPTTAVRTIYLLSGGSVRRYVLTCLLLMICSLRLHV